MSIHVKAYRGEDMGWYVTKDGENHGHGASLEAALLDWHNKHGQDLPLQVPAKELTIILPEKDEQT